jgi:hypothetical protein
MSLSVARNRAMFPMCNIQTVLCVCAPAGSTVGAVGVHTHALF